MRVGTGCAAVCAGAEVGGGAALVGGEAMTFDGEDTGPEGVDERPDGAATIGADLAGRDVVVVTSGVPSASTREVANCTKNVGGIGSVLSSAGITMTSRSLNAPWSIGVMSPVQLPLSSRVSATGFEQSGFGAEA